MGTATHVPQTTDMIGDELSGDEAWTALRRYGGWRFLRDAFVRFRYADGFSHSRALALQTVLALIPFAIAVVGLSVALHTESVGQVAELTLRRVVPHASSDLVTQALQGSREEGRDHGEIALWLGLAFALANLTTAMCQIERGANRIYGCERDRSFPRKYAAGLRMAVAGGLPLGLGFLTMVAGDAIGDAVVSVYGAGHGLATTWDAVRWPLGVMLAMLAGSAVFRWSPRRRQPGYTWLAFGAAVYLTLWTVLTWLLSLYVSALGSFDAVYGPLSAFVALLLWAYLTSLAVFLGIAFAAQLEASRAGVHEPAKPDPGV